MRPTDIARGIINDITEDQSIFEEKRAIRAGTTYNIAKIINNRGYFFKN